MKTVADHIAAHRYYKFVNHNTKPRTKTVQQTSVPLEVHIPPAQTVRSLHKPTANSKNQKEPETSFEKVSSGAQMHAETEAQHEVATDEVAQGHLSKGRVGFCLTLLTEPQQIHS